MKDDDSSLSGRGALPRDGEKSIWEIKNQRRSDEEAMRSVSVR